MKTKEGLNVLKEEVETVSTKLHGLTEEELALVSMKKNELVTERIQTFLPEFIKTIHLQNECTFYGLLTIFYCQRQDHITAPTKSTMRCCFGRRITHNFTEHAMPSW